MKNWVLLQVLGLLVASAAHAVPLHLNGHRSQPMGMIAGTQNEKSQAIPSTSNVFNLNIPTRFQWNNNNGYCGETSMISAGLYFGQYVSQFTARAVATGGPQVGDNNQLLLGQNANTAATAMHLAFVEWTPSTDVNQFLTWVKAYTLNGFPVTIGVYTNECLFYDTCTSSAGETDYDHIVPVLGMQSDQPLTPPPLPPSSTLAFLSMDQITFSDNGLQGPVSDPIMPPNLPNPADPYYFQYGFATIQKTRAQANQASGPWYSLTNGVDRQGMLTVNTYGIAILGVEDLNGDTIPVRVDTNVNYEYPQIVDGSETEPAPMPLMLTITVTIADQTSAYNLYRYNDLTKIPNSMFNTNAPNAVQKITIPAQSGPTFVTTLNIMSNEVAAYRCVKTTAP